MDVPTNIHDLKAAISAQWPEVRESAMALEFYDPDTLRTLIEGKDKPTDFNRAIVMCHKMVGENGFIDEASVRDTTQIFFSEEDCVRAMWFRYNQLTPPSDFSTDITAAFFVWRCDPEVVCRNGAYFGRMRYSAMWRDHNGRPYSQFIASPR